MMDAAMAAKMILALSAVATLGLFAMIALLAGWGGIALAGGILGGLALMWAVVVDDDLEFNC